MLEQEVLFKFVATVIPKGCHKPRVENYVGRHTVRVQEVSGDQAPIAFRVHKREPNGEGLVLRWFGGHLWKRRVYSEARTPDVLVTREIFIKKLVGTDHAYGYGNPLRRSWQDEVREYPELDVAGLVTVPRSSHGAPVKLRKIVSHNREQRIAEIDRIMSGFILIGDEVWEHGSEPRFVVQTFGLGSNHGGTALFVTHFYNPNIAASAYFRADQLAEAIAYAEERAAKRGDTQSVPIKPHGAIEVLVPEAVRCSPAQEHGDGDPFLNDLEAATQGSDPKVSPFIALAVMAQHITKS